MTEGEDDVLNPADIGSEGPPIEEKPYKIVFEANKCIGTGKCAAASENWSLDLDTGIARPESYFVDERELAENVDAAERCPAKKGDGVIHVIDRRSGEEIAPDPEGGGSVSVDRSRIVLGGYPDRVLTYVGSAFLR